jgi:hypothetical protein
MVRLPAAPQTSIKTTTPKGVFVFMETVESLLLKGIHKDKRTMRRMVSVFYLQDGNKWVT